MTGIIFGEKSTTKIAGILPDEEQATALARQIRSELNLNQNQVRVMRPEDAAEARKGHYARQMQPESQGIFRTLIRAHLTMGIAGLVAGGLLFVFFYFSGNAMVLANPLLAAIAMTTFGMLIGLILGGLLSLRPDQGAFSREVREALQGGRWAVVVHPIGNEQVEAAQGFLEQRKVRAMHSL